MIVLCVQGAETEGEDIITPLNDVVSEITEHLRAKENMDYSALFSKMWDIYHKFEELL